MNMFDVDVRSWEGADKALGGRNYRHAGKFFLRSHGDGSISVVYDGWQLIRYYPFVALLDRDNQEKMLAVAVLTADDVPTEAVVHWLNSLLPKAYKVHERDGTWWVFRGEEPESKFRGGMMLAFSPRDLEETDENETGDSGG